jgi:hypothetical protein
LTPNDTPAQPRTEHGERLEGNVAALSTGVLDQPAAKPKRQVRSMVEHLQSGPSELGAPMDYAEHERTYAMFLTAAKLGVVSTVDTLIALALFSFGSGGFWLGTIVLILMAIALVMGLVARGSVKPLLVVTVIGALLFAISVG